MKKTITILFINLFLLSGLFADSDSFFTTEVSLGTGVSIYDSSANELRKELLTGKNYKRIVAGLTLDTNLNLSDALKILLGADLFTDFLWDQGKYYNSIDYSFFTGIKFFPGKSGLNFSISYVLGNRSDFYSDKNETKAWGNGFRIGIQYDFMQDKKYRIKPSAGAYYRCVPRGNYSKDHILCLYGGIRF